MKKRACDSKLLHFFAYIFYNLSFWMLLKVADKYYFLPDFQFVFPVIFWSEYPRYFIS